jgi:hypothetical protein
MGNKEAVSIKEIVEYNLDKIPSDEVMQMHTKDFLYIYRVLEEFNRYFHNPDHYKSIEDVKKFLGKIDSGGAFEVLSIAIYHKLYKVKLSEEIQEMIDDSVFELPLYPEYYEPTCDGE